MKEQNQDIALILPMFPVALPQAVQKSKRRKIFTRPFNFTLKECRARALSFRRIIRKVKCWFLLLRSPNPGTGKSNFWSAPGCKMDPLFPLAFRAAPRLAQTRTLSLLARCGTLLQPGLFGRACTLLQRSVRIPQRLYRNTLLQFLQRSIRIEIQGFFLSRQQVEKIIRDGIDHCGAINGNKNIFCERVGF